MTRIIRCFTAAALCLALLLPVTATTVRAAEPDRAPRVALTFDDGPHPGRTKRILELLDRYSVKATFFILGCNAEYYPDPLEMAVRAGHEIEDHSFDHVTRGENRRGTGEQYHENGTDHRACVGASTAVFSSARGENHSGTRRSASGSRVRHRVLDGRFARLDGEARRRDRERRTENRARRRYPPVPRLHLSRREYSARA